MKQTVGRVSSPPYLNIMEIHLVVNRGVLEMVWYVIKIVVFAGIVVWLVRFLVKK